MGPWGVLVSLPLVAAAELLLLLEDAASAVDVFPSGDAVGVPQILQILNISSISDVPGNIASRLNNSAIMVPMAHISIGDE